MVIQKRVLFTRNARIEMINNHLIQGHVYEAIFNAPAIAGTTRSKRTRTDKAKTQYLLNGVTFDGVFVCTKGKIDKDGNVYVLISSKRATD